jgi:hypothetical protein
VPPSAPVYPTGAPQPFYPPPGGYPPAPPYPFPGQPPAGQPWPPPPNRFAASPGYPFQQYAPGYGQPIQHASLFGDAPRPAGAEEWGLGIVIGFTVLSFCIPIAGWVLFGLRLKSQESAAIPFGAFATLGFLIELLVSLSLSLT